MQSGEKDNDILCEQCDNKILGTLEGYASRVLFTGKGKDVKNIKTENQLHPDGKLVSTYCENVDYTRFKLFLLSILWRASISKLDFFKAVQLGPKEESLRKMIFENDALFQFDFPCVISSFTQLHRRMASGVISSPRRVRSEKGTRYVFQIGQLVLVYFVSESDMPYWIRGVAITPNNKMRIIHYDNERGKNMMDRLFGDTMVHALHLAATKSKIDN